MVALQCFNSSTSLSFPAAAQIDCTFVVLCALQVRARSKQDLGSMYLCLLLDSLYCGSRVSEAGQGPSTCSQSSDVSQYTELNSLVSTLSLSNSS